MPCYFPSLGTRSSALITTMTRQWYLPVGAAKSNTPVSLHTFSFMALYKFVFNFNF